MSLIGVVLSYFHVLGGYEKSGSILDILSSHRQSLASMYIFALSVQDAKRCQKSLVVLDSSFDTVELCSYTPSAAIPEVADIISVGRF